MLSIQVPMTVPGRYKLAARLTYSFDYATVQFRFNGTPVGNPVDCQEERLEVRSIPLGIVSAVAGTNTLEVEITAVPSPLRPSKWPAGFGLDQVLMERQSP